MKLFESGRQWQALVVGLFLAVGVLIGCNSTESSTGAGATASTPRASAPAPSPTPHVTSTPRPTPSPTPTFGQLKVRADTIDYRELFRNNEKYFGNTYYFRARVLQVIEVGIRHYDLRVGVGGRGYDDVIYLANHTGDRLLEDDIIEFVGVSKGLERYIATFGNVITIPRLESVAVKLIEQ